MGKLTINWPFSIAMLVYQRVHSPAQTTCRWWKKTLAPPRCCLERSARRAGSCSSGWLKNLWLLCELLTIHFEIFGDTILMNSNVLWPFEEKLDFTSPSLPVVTHKCCQIWIQYDPAISSDENDDDDADGDFAAFFGARFEPRPLATMMG